VGYLHEWAIHKTPNDTTALLYGWWAGPIFKDTTKGLLVTVTETWT